MEKKTIAKLAVSAVILILGIVFACGLGRGGEVNYQKPGPYTAESANDYSSVQVAMTVQGDKILDAAITSSGDNDLLNDETRAEWAQSIVDNQSYENDVISSATLVYSAASVKEAAADIFTQAGLPTPEPAATPEPEPEPEPEGEAEPAGAGALAADTYAVEKTTDFSTINVVLTVEGDVVTAADITSEGDSDLLTDEIRDSWEAQIVEKQAIDAVSGVTVSSSAVQEAVEQLLAGIGDDEAAGLTDGTYSIQKTTDFSTIDVEMTVEGGKVTAANITSEGANDLLTDDHRDTWEAQIVEKQAVDAVSGVTVSSNAVQEAVDELLTQAKGEQAAADSAEIAELKAALADAEARAEAAEAKAAESEAKVAELEAAAAAAAASAAVEGAPEAESSGLVDGTYAVRKTTDFSDIDVAITVLGGKITQAVVYSEGANDLLTDEHRSAWAEQIVNSQAVDAVSGVTVSSTAVQEALAELLERAKGDEAEAKAEAEAPAANADASRYMRPRPAAAAAPAEAEAAEAKAEAEAPAVNADASRYMRPRPAAAAAPAEAEAVEAKAEAEAPAVNADASRYMRPRPAAAAAPAEAETAEAAPAELTEEERISAILPSIVTTMGDNRDNSYIIDYLEQDPYLVNIYEGFGFAKEYGSARGHEYTLEDLNKTARPHPKANCITCKTPDLHKMIEEQGVAVYSMPYDEVFPQMKNNITCYTCHGDDMGNGGTLVVTHQYVNEALGDNASAIKPATLACGQCHIEYYFTPEDSETMMPYHSVEEMTPEAILAYYDGMGFSDWTQESTGTGMLKAQHPEMETYLQGKHAALLSCADCHMPAETTSDGVEYRSHKLVSPLENEALLASCAQCHGDTDMVGFVHGIQEKVTARETEVGNKLSAMKDALAAAVASGEWSEEDLNALRKLHREAQWFFDFCYVENAEGAHNSELAMNCLDTAEAKIDEAMKRLNKT